jgi:hypothetical protein
LSSSRLVGLDIGILLLRFLLSPLCRLLLLRVLLLGKDRFYGLVKVLFGPRRSLLSCVLDTGKERAQS